MKAFLSSWHIKTINICSSYQPSWPSMAKIKSWGRGIYQLEWRVQAFRRYQAGNASAIMHNNSSSISGMLLKSKKLKHWRRAALTRRTVCTGSAWVKQNINKMKREASGEANQLSRKALYLQFHRLSFSNKNSPYRVLYCNITGEHLFHRYSCERGVRDDVSCRKTIENLGLNRLCFAWNVRRRGVLALVSKYREINKRK